MSRDTSGKNNPMYGREHSAETKEKIRQKTLARDSSTYDKNRHKTKEQLAKLQKGRELYQLANGHPMSRRSHSPEARKKISEAMKLRHKILGY